MFRKKIYRITALLMAAMMAFSLTACRKSTPEPEATTETEEGSNVYDFAAEGVNLPEDFENMIYPIRAVMTQVYSTGAGYYGTEGNEDPSLFWFSMAELVSLMNSYVSDLAEDSAQAYAFLDDEKVDMFASSLYDRIGTGELEMPELSDMELFAVFDEEKDQYGFLISDEEGFSAIITEARQEGDELILKAELLDAESEEPYGEYLITVVPSKWEGEENEFPYSVRSIETLKRFDEESYEGRPVDPDPAPEKDTEEDGSQEMDGTLNGTDISEDQALELARDMYGDGEYEYIGTETLGDDVYYDFRVQVDGLRATDVLVSMSGADVIAGSRNEDGTWSLEE